MSAGLKLTLLAGLAFANQVSARAVHSFLCSIIHRSGVLINFKEIYNIQVSCDWSGTGVLQCYGHVQVDASFASGKKAQTRFLLKYF